MSTFVGLSVGLSVEKTQSRGLVIVQQVTRLSYRIHHKIKRRKRKRGRRRYGRRRRGRKRWKVSKGQIYLDLLDHTYREPHLLINENKFLYDQFPTLDSLDFSYCIGKVTCFGLNNRQYKCLELSNTRLCVFPPVCQPIHTLNRKHIESIVHT